MFINNTRPLGVPGIGAHLTGIQWVAIIVCGWMISILLSLLPELWNAPFSLVQDDARHHVVWLRQIADPELYAGDPTAAFFLSQSPIAYQVLYLPAHWLKIDVAVWHLLVLAPVTCVLTTCAIYRFSVHILPTTQQRGMITLILCLLLAASAIQGLQRNFTLSIFLFAWAAYLERRVLLTGLVFLVGANIYPVAAAAAGIGILAHLIVPIRPYEIFNRRAMLTVAVAGVAGLAGVVPFLLSSADAGPTLLLQEARDMPFLQDGRSSFFKQSLWDQIFCNRVGGASIVPICIRIGQTEASNLTLAVVLAVIVLGSICYRWILLGTGAQGIRFAQPTAKVAVSWLVAGISLFVAAYALAFRLYLPDRYAFLSVELVYQMSIAMLAFTLFLGLIKIVGRLVPALRPVLPLVILCVSWIVFVTFSADEFALNGDPEPKISAYLRTTPKDTVVAGFDEYLDSVPAHGLRSTYAAIELILPYKTRYLRLMRDRTFRMRDAFAAKSGHELSAFATRENIDLMVLPHGDMRISKRWKRSFPSLAALDGLSMPMGISPDGTDCVVAFGRNVNLVDPGCLDGKP